MIVIVEGVDRCGKTTLCKKLESKGFIYLKDTSPRVITRAGEDAKLKTFASIISNLPKDCNVVVDRLHYTEYVYGVIERKYCSVVAYDVDNMLSKRDDVAIVLMLSENIQVSSYQHGSDLEPYEEMFKGFYVESNIQIKRTCHYKNIDTLCEGLIKIKRR